MIDHRVRSRRTQILPAMLVAVATLGFPRAALAQDLGIFEVIGKFVASFKAASAFYAPLGGVISSDALREEGGLTQIGFFMRRPDIDVGIGLDVTNGFTARDEALDLRGSIRALPTLTKFFDRPVLIHRSVPTFLNVGVSAGASQLANGRSQILDPAGDRAIEVKGNGFHLGLSVGLSFSVGSFGGYVDGSFRYTDFASLDWREGSKSIVPPSGWPLTMDMWTGVIRLGMGFAFGAASTN